MSYAEEMRLTFPNQTHATVRLASNQWGVGSCVLMTVFWRREKSKKDKERKREKKREKERKRDRKNEKYR